MVTVLPVAWEFVASFGARQMSPSPGMIPANISLGEDTVAGADGLAGYIAAQAKLIEHHLGSPKMAGPQPVAFAGADEAFLFFVRHVPEGAGNMLHAQTYVRAGMWVGIITLTTPESELKIVRPDYDAFVKGLRIAAGPSSDVVSRSGS